MPRPYPPPDFKCLYTHSCPYLDWMSTQWAMEQVRRADKGYQEQLRIIDNFSESLQASEKRVRALERENAELKAKLKALHERQFKPNKKKGSDKVSEVSPGKQGKKRGAPVGHPGWFRPAPSRIDRTIAVAAPEICPHCNSDRLTPTGDLHEHIQEDIVIRPQTLVTRYVHEEAFCNRCRRPVVQAGEGEILNAPIGPVAKAVSLYLRYSIGVTYRKVVRIFREIFGLGFVPASALGFDRKAAKSGKPLYEDLREKIRIAARLHADETHWRNNGLNHFVWFAGNEQLAFFYIHRNRSSEVAKSIFGESFTGVLVRDRYSAYNGIGADWQACLAHIITTLKEILREHALLPEKEQDRHVALFCERGKKLFSKACETAQRLASGEIQWERSPELQQHFTTELNRICKRTLSFKPAETLRAWLTGPEQHHLFTFLRHPGLQPTNNHAEQSLRQIVIFRKICFGTRSETGLETHSILPSLIQTAIRQGRQPLSFLQLLFTSDYVGAQAALYQNSS